MEDSCETLASEWRPDRVMLVTVWSCRLRLLSHEVWLRHWKEKGIWATNRLFSLIQSEKLKAIGKRACPSLWYWNAFDFLHLTLKTICLKAKWFPSTQKSVFFHFWPYPGKLPILSWYLMSSLLSLPQTQGTGPDWPKQVTFYTCVSIPHKPVTGWGPGHVAWVWPMRAKNTSHKEFSARLSFFIQSF